MIKFYVLSFFTLVSNNLLACPYCAGSDQSGKDSNTTLVLALFILAIYIPYYLILRMIKKHRALQAAMNEQHDSTGLANS